MIIGKTTDTFIFGKILIKTLIFYVNRLRSLINRRNTVSTFNFHQNCIAPFNVCTFRRINIMRSRIHIIRFTLFIINSNVIMTAFRIILIFTIPRKAIFFYYYTVLYFNKLACFHNLTLIYKVGRNLLRSLDCTSVAPNVTMLNSAERLRRTVVIIFYISLTTYFTVFTYSAEISAFGQLPKFTNSAKIFTDLFNGRFIFLSFRHKYTLERNIAIPEHNGTV